MGILTKKRLHFSKVMRDKEICIALLERLLKLKIADIVYLEEEKSINIEYAAKSVRLDVYVEDGNRAFNQCTFDIESTLKCRQRPRVSFLTGAGIIRE